MSKGMTILYKVHNGLYVNMTNRCQIKNVILILS